jgi:hypothetical protein
MPDNLLPDSDIPGLPGPYTNPKAGDFLAIYDAQNAVTKKIDISYLLPAAPSSNYKWIPGYTYALNVIVEYAGLWYKSLQAGNIGHLPTEAGSLFWEEVEQSAAGFVPWAAGVFTQDEVFVLYELDGYTQLFKLASATRPYLSDDLLLEFADGDWELVSEYGYMGVNQAHSFLVGDVLTHAGGDWVPATGVDSENLAIVRQVLDANNFVIKTTGGIIKTFSGLTVSATYYRQPDASLGTPETDFPVMVAISATTAILLASGGGSDSLAAANEYTDEQIAQEVIDRNTAIAAYAAGAVWKTAVRVATTVPLPANTQMGGGLTLVADANGALPDVDDITLVDGDTILVKDEADPTKNGAYDVTTEGDISNQWVLTRRADSDADAELIAATYPVVEGTDNGDTSWRQITAAPVIGTDDIEFTPLGGSIPDAAEGLKGKAALATQATIENEATTNDTEITTPKKFWLGLARLRALAWTWALKQTFTTAPNFASTTANQILEVNGAKDLVSAAKGSAYNKDFASDGETITGTEAAKPIAPSNLTAWWTAIKAATVTFGANIIAKQYGSAVQTLVDAATVAWDGALGQNAQVTLGGNRTLGAISNPVNGTLYRLRVIQDGTGGRTLAFNAAYLFGTSASLTLAAGGWSNLAFLYDGTNFIYQESGGSNESLVDLGNISGAVSVNLALGRHFKAVITANITSFTFTNESLGAVYYFDFTRTTTNFTIAFTAGKFRFPLGLAPLLTDPATNGTVGVTATDTLVFKCGVTGRLDTVLTPDLQNN